MTTDTRAFARRLAAMAVLLLAATPTPHARAPRGSATNRKSQSAAGSVYARLALSFEANRGQTDARAAFIARGRGYTLFLGDSEAVLGLRQGRDSAVMRMALVGANPHARAVGVEPLTTRTNYYLGNDPARWRTGVPTYARVSYEAVYPGVDLVYYGNQRELEYDFVVAPGADPAAITLSVTGQTGGRSTPWTTPRIDGSGDLVAGSDAGDVRFHKPVVYQTAADGGRVAVDGRYSLDRHGMASFAIGHYDRTRPLVIDPVLAYSTYLGGSENDEGHGIAVDVAGNMYVTGLTYSSDFPVVNALQSVPQTVNSGLLVGDAFVARIAADGSTLDYATYLGGSQSDVGTAIAVDAAGNASVTGYTTSTDFPTRNAIQNTRGGDPTQNGVDGFVTRITPTGTLDFSTYLGGSLVDEGIGIAVDSVGDIYVAGDTTSWDFPISHAAQPLHGGAGFEIYIANYDAFVTKIRSDGSAVAYSTYLGGSNFYTNGDDHARDIAVDAAGNAYVAGVTQSTDFPARNAAQPFNRGGSFQGNDGFVSKVSPDGAAFLYSTYVGGTDEDLAAGVAVDGSGRAYVVGDTRSPDFPMQAPFQNTIRSSEKAFVTVVDTNQVGPASLVFSTYLGGSSNDTAFDVAVDSVGDIYVTGSTVSTDFPVTSSAIQPGMHGPGDGFVTKFGPLTSIPPGLAYSSYLGGSSLEASRAIATSASGLAVYVTGNTYSSDFPLTANAVRTTASDGEAFVTKFTFKPRLTLPVFPVFGLVLDGSGSTPFVLHSVDGFSDAATFDVTGQPAGMTVTPQHFTLTPPADGTVSQTIVIATGPSVAPGTYALLVKDAATGDAAPLTVQVSATTASAAQVVGALQAAGCTGGAGVASVLTGELNAAQSLVNSHHVPAAIATYAAMLLEIRALQVAHVLPATCTVDGVGFSPANALVDDVRGLLAGLKTGTTSNPISGYVVAQNGVAVPNATMSLQNATGGAIATAKTDITGFYFFPTAGALVSGSSYTVKVTGFPPQVHASSPASQSFTWAGMAISLGNFTVN